MLPPTLIELILLGLISGIRDFALFWWLLMQQLIELPAVFELAINISLFSFLGFLLYEKALNPTVSGKNALSVTTVRKFARIYLASTFLLFFAYILAYLRGVGWVASTFGESTLRGLEGFTGFLGFVALLWPVYPLFRLLAGKQPISKAKVPDLDQIMYGTLMILGYGGLFYGLQISTHALFARLSQLMLLLGIIGMVGAIWLANENEKKRDRLHQAIVILAMNPLFTVVFLAAIHGWGWV
jgi:hypothetical protein